MPRQENQPSTNPDRFMRLKRLLGILPKLSEQTPPKELQEKSDWQIIKEALGYANFQFSDATIRTRGGDKHVIQIWDKDHPENTLLSYQIEADIFLGKEHSFICRPSNSINFTLQKSLDVFIKNFMKVNPNIKIRMEERPEYGFA